MAGQWQGGDQYLPSKEDLAAPAPAFSMLSPLSWPYPCTMLAVSEVHRHVGKMGCGYLLKWSD